MTTTFQKRQKEMKRMEKARMKAERRAQKKLTDREPGEAGLEIGAGGDEIENMAPLSGPIQDPQFHN
jgi:hypothetical protein